MRQPKNRDFSGMAVAFKALSDPIRLRLLNLLSEGEVCVCFLGEVLKMVQPKISRHLAYLKRAGLVTARREGKWIHYAWAEHRNTAVRNVMNGLRDSLAKDEKFQRERELLKKVCC